MGKYKLHIIWAAVAVIALVGGIFWGKAMGASGARQFAGGGAFSSSTRSGFAGRAGFVNGQVSAIDSSSITLQLPNGNSEVVFYSTSTAVSEPQSVPVSKVAVGTNVAVMGSQNSDGSMTASSIQVGGAGGFRGGIPGSTAGQ